MNLRTTVDLNISADKKKLLTRPDFQAQFNVMTVDTDGGHVICETKDDKTLYSALESHFHYLAHQDHCNLMYLLDVDTYNKLTVFWAKSEKAVATALDNIEHYKTNLSISHQLDLNKFLVKLFSHPEQNLIH